MLGPEIRAPAPNYLSPPSYSKRAKYSGSNKEGNLGISTWRRSLGTTWYVPGSPRAISVDLSPRFSSENAILVIYRGFRNIFEFPTVRSDVRSILGNSWENRNFCIVHHFVDKLAFDSFEHCPPWTNAARKLSKASEYAHLDHLSVPGSPTFGDSAMAGKISKRPRRGDGRCDLGTRRPRVVACLDTPS